MQFSPSAGRFTCMSRPRTSRQHMVSANFHAGNASDRATTTACMHVWNNKTNEHRPRHTIMRPCLIRTCHRAAWRESSRACDPVQFATAALAGRWCRTQVSSKPGAPEHRFGQAGGSAFLWAMIDKPGCQHQDRLVKAFQARS